MAKILKTYLKYFIPHFYSPGGGSSQPAAPDPYATAGAQFKYNKLQSAFDAKQNRYTQNNPLGSVSWQNTGTDENPSWVQNTSLSKAQQGLYDTQTGTQQTLSDKASNYANSLDPQHAYQADYSGLGTQNQGYGQTAQNQLSQFSNDPSQSYSSGLQSQLSQFNNGPTSFDATGVRDQAQQALMDRLNPSLMQDQTALQTQLTNQGLTPGSEAYQRSMLQNSQKMNDARLAAINQSGAEAQRAQQMAQTNQGMNQSAQQQIVGNTNALQGLDSANQNMNLAGQNQILSNASGLQNMDYGARNQYLSEQGTRQGQSNTSTNQNMSTLAQLLQGQGNVNMPTYGGGSTLNTGSAPDIAGLINSYYQSQVNSANAGQSGKNSMLGSGAGALGSLGGSAISTFGGK